MKRFLILLVSVLVSVTVVTAQSRQNKPVASTAWYPMPPLGLHEAAGIDTLTYNLFQMAVPSSVSPAFATTGNQASEGINMIYMDREPMSRFFFLDSKQFWLPTQRSLRFYNTAIPMSIVSYSTGGGRELAQDWFKFLFSGNFSRRGQVGLDINYPYSKGSYNHQAAKGFNWRLFGSYMGDRYELQASYDTFNMLNQENGGVTDDLYILDPAVLQGGLSKINPRSIPTRLNGSTSRVRGKNLYINQRYKVGFWKELLDSVTDTIVGREYVPVSSFIWTFKYGDARHRFRNTNASDESEFWENHYFSDDHTADLTRTDYMENTVGVSLLEGFNKYAKAGLAAFLTHEMRTYYQTPDTLPLSGSDRPAGLTPYPFDQRMAHKGKETFVYAGAQLTKQQGLTFNYDATVKLGIAGAAAGEIFADGGITTRIRLLGDTVSLRGYGSFANESAPYLMEHYVSNHFIWKNDFGKIRRLRFGGTLTIPHTGTRINVAVENVQNHIYFGSDFLPVQNGGSVQVLAARLEQNLRWKALNWRNTVIYQTTTNESVIPLPQLSIYSNLYLWFKVAHVLDVQLGVDLDYYTRYHAPAYQPSTMAFCNQQEIKCGNYPFMCAYINMKLSRARFFLVWSHVNQGIFGGSDYFSTPHYPLNPRRFQMGVSVDFLN
ncbi:MAG: putative porin [Muribaculaceae bacterium]|nr:putative porin [Muribaculaceae bacterium]